MFLTLSITLFLKSKPGLKCFQRNGDENQIIPGCRGIAQTDWDYCYDPGSDSPSTSPTMYRKDWNPRFLALGVNPESARLNITVEFSLPIL